MSQRHLLDTKWLDDWTQCVGDANDTLDQVYVKAAFKTLYNTERYVLVTIFLFAALLPLVSLQRRFASQCLKLLSLLCYILVPELISYTMGLMGQTGPYRGKNQFPGILVIWAVFLLFAFASFDNLSAFNLGEIKHRSNLFLQFVTQVVLLLLFLYTSPLKVGILAIALAFLLVCLKLGERIAALAHAAGATPGIKGSIRGIIDYMNEHENGEDEEDYKGRSGPMNDVVLRSKYLVGPRCSTTKNNKIIDGIDVEKIWGCKGRVLGSGDPNGQFKDTCLSFSLFWLLLGKFFGYPSYEGKAKTRAWKLVRDGLVGPGGEHERVFRVIEVELGFLHDFFYTKYIFYYLNGFYWKLYFLTIPVMFWWFTRPDDYSKINSVYKSSYNIDPNLNPKATETMMLVILALEVMQLGMIVTSRWFRVTMLSYYAKRKMSNLQKNALYQLLDWFLDKFIGTICLVSLCASTVSSKPWKRNLDQYSLLESSTCFGVKKNGCLEALGAVLGIPVRKPGRKPGSSVALSGQVKRAIALTLQTNGSELKLSKGLACLRRNGVEDKLSWACELKSDAETVLVWHIATSMCEMVDQRQNSGSSEDDDDHYKVATALSKYCAYLLSFAPCLVSLPVLEAEEVCESAVKEARKLFKKPAGSNLEVNKYEKMKEYLHAGDEGSGEGETTTSVLRKGAMLGEELVSALGEDGGIKWKVLAEFWAEMILFLAPSNDNEMVHVSKLAEGGEFITHLWALLIHAGIVDRDDVDLAA